VSVLDSHKRTIQLFLSTHDDTLFLAAMRVRDLPAWNFNAAIKADLRNLQRNPSTTHAQKIQ
jgi:hypothetical protein